MITQKQILEWMADHVNYRLENGFPEDLDQTNGIQMYAVGLYEGYYSALKEYGKEEVEDPDETHTVEQF